MLRDCSLRALLVGEFISRLGSQFTNLALPGFVLAICGASLPLINAPYLGWLSMRVPPALRGQVLQSTITINQLAGPLDYIIAGPIFVHAGLHVAYSVIAALATGASLNFIVAMQGSGALVQKTA